MKGFRFYLEHDTPRDKRRGKHNGNVVAVSPENTWIDAQGEAIVETIGSVFHHPNSPVAGTDASWNYIQENCKRISEQEAREIHPELFKFLDD